ncbi:MAG: histidine phosphatase family protein [Nanoarchaeota archaeon]|nr:histidine phosphatase family protein [Nanoarchaeota archaeon]
MVRLYLIRHAQTAFNVDDKYIGGRSNHLLLTAEGERQACLLGDRLFDENIPFSRVYASPAVRTRATAQIVCQRIGFPLLDIHIDDRLQELSQGDWEGRFRAEVYTPEVLRWLNTEVWVDRWNRKAPNGESQKDIEQRMFGFFQEKIYALPNEEVVGIFTHGFAIKCCLRKVLNHHPKETYRRIIENTGITILDYDTEHWSVEVINDKAHLEFFADQLYLR